MWYDAFNMNIKYASVLDSLLRQIARADDEFQLQLARCAGVHPRTFRAFLDKAEFAPVVEGRLNTVNVVEMNNGEFQMIRSFPETPEGNKAAEDFFARKIQQHNSHNEMSAADIGECVEEGTYEDCGGYQLFLTHSV